LINAEKYISLSDLYSQLLPLFYKWKALAHV
jgi:hypothetical protein